MIRREEDYKNGKLNYAKANSEDLMKFFGRIEWGGIMNSKTAQEKYEIILRKHHEGMERYVPKYKIESSKHTWYNARCAVAKRTKDKT